MPETTEQVEEPAADEIQVPTLIILEGTEDAPVCENGVCL